MDFKKRRFFFNGFDPLQKVLNDKNINFRIDNSKQQVLSDAWEPVNDEDGNEIIF